MCPLQLTSLFTTTGHHLFTRAHVFSPELMYPLNAAHPSIRQSFYVCSQQCPCLFTNLSVHHSSPLCSLLLTCMFTTADLSLEQYMSFCSPELVCVHHSSPVHQTSRACVRVCVGVCVFTKAHPSLHQSSFPLFFWGYMTALVYKEKVT